MIAAKTGRVVVLEHDGVRPLRMNAWARLQPYAQAAETRDWRQAFGTRASDRRHKPMMGMVHVTVTPLHRTSASPQDVAACAPAAKAAIDGCVDAGLLHDDSPAHVLQVLFTAPDVCGRDGLRVTLEEVKLCGTR